LTKTISYPNGTSAAYTYYPTNRVESIAHKDAGAATISSYGYQYDRNGNRTRQVELQNGVSETTAYVYDGLDRLENFTLTSGATTRVTAYTFDGHNRKTETVTVDGATTVDKTYSYDETNWLTRVVDSVAGTTMTYQYDDNGNTTLKTDSGKPGEDLLFEYDVANRLVQTTQNSTVLGKYDYNAQGMRIRHHGSERGDVEYIYDDGAVLEEYSGGLLAHYRYGDRLLSLDAPSDGGVQYYHHDALGSTVNLTDSAGATKVSYSLDPWGNIRNQVGSSVNRQIFTGQEHDTNTGLIYFGARYYDPDSARFISQDSYLGEAGTPPSLHRYMYAYSNPMVYVDLDGYFSWPANATEPEWNFNSTDGMGSRMGQAIPAAHAKTKVAFRESIDNAYAKGLENGVPGLDNDFTRLVLTAGSTLTQATFAVGSAPLEKAVESIEYGKDPSQVQNFPILMTSFRNVYRASEQAAKEGSLVNWLNVGSAASSTLVESVAVSCGVNAAAGKPSVPRAGITVESKSGADTFVAPQKAFTDLDKIKSLEIDGLKAQRIVHGNNGKIAVIGRSMGNDKIKGVRDYATVLKNKGYDVELFDGNTIPRSARKEFERLTEGGRWLTNSDLVKSEMYKANKSWAKKIKSEGYTIIDIGNPHNQGFSPFYSVEKKEIFKGE